MPDLSDCGHGLLGQNGFFDNVSFVKFRTRAGILVLDQALERLSELPLADQDLAAVELMSFVKHVDTSEIQLSDEQLAEVDRRLRKKDPEMLTMAELDARLKRRGIWNWRSARKPPMTSTTSMIGSPDGEAIGRPVIPIFIRNPPNNETIEYEALVASGADRCVFASEIGEMIGIDIPAGDQQYVSGVIEGERRPMYFHPVHGNLIFGKHNPLAAILFEQVCPVFCHV